QHDLRLAFAESFLRALVEHVPAGGGRHLDAVWPELELFRDAGGLAMRARGSRSQSHDKRPDCSVADQFGNSMLATTASKTASVSCRPMNVQMNRWELWTTYASRAAYVRPRSGTSTV